MASDNILLRNRKQRYKVIDFNTKDVLEKGFTSQKSAKEWIKENKKANVNYSIACMTVKELESN